MSKGVINDKPYVCLSDCSGSYPPLLLNEDIEAEEGKRLAFDHITDNDRCFHENMFASLLLNVCLLC